MDPVKDEDDDFLGTDEMIAIMRDVSLGRPSKLKTPKAIEFREQYEKGAAEAAAKGLTLDIPYEFPDF